jgi:hypothetical protein
LVDSLLIGRLNILTLIWPHTGSLYRLVNHQAKRWMQHTSKYKVDFEHWYLSFCFQREVISIDILYITEILFKVVLNNINQTKPSTYIILYKLITDNPLRTSQFIIIWIKYHMLYCTFKVLCIVDGNGSSSCPLVLKRRKTYQMSC